MCPGKLFSVGFAALLLVVLSAISQEPPAKKSTVSPGEEHKLLAAANPEMRLAAALELAKANHAVAVPVLIDLLTVLPADKRLQVEEFLNALAGEWAPGTPTAEDEIGLRIRRGIWADWWASTDGPALLEMFRKRTLTAAEQDRVRRTIVRLGDPAYQVREKATIELVARGPMILPILRETLAHKDPEIASRAQHCMRRIEEEPANRLPLAALRLLALRKPAGAADTLLAYLPFAEEDAVAELQSALSVLAVREGKPEPALVRALADARPMVRTAAAEALAPSAGPDALPAVRKLLSDADVNVRLRVAQALAPRDAQAVPVLIALLPGLAGDQAWQVHDFLSRLAGDAAPPGPDDTPESRKKTGAAWAEWWKENSAKADLAKLVNSQLPVLGYTVICDYNSGVIVELGRDRKPRWSFTGTQSPVDVWVLPNNRVLVAEYNGSKVTERDFKGNIIWQRQTNGSPRSVQRLPNGHTLLATNSQITEVDRNGKDVLTFSIATAHFGITGAYKDRKGQIICCDQDSGVCSRYAGGKKLSSFASNRTNVWLDLLPSGRILLAQNGGNKIAEYDAAGKLLLELNVPNVTTASGLPSGNFLVSCVNAGVMMEVDRKGQTVWEYKMPGAFRARGR